MNIISRLVHFYSNGRPSIDVSKAKFTRVVTSIDDCAFSCLNNAKMNGLSSTQVIKCMSFEFCQRPDAPDSFTCVFNSFTTAVDPSLILPDTISAPRCEHYSKSSFSFDYHTVLELYNLVENVALINNKFQQLNFNDNNNKPVQFPQIDVFRTAEHFDFTIDDSDGLTSLTDKFEVETKGEFDFNESKLKSLNEPLSQRSGISFDECALLCLGEQSFVCLSFTYGVSFRACKWSSFNANVPNLDVAFDTSSGINLFRS